MARIIGGIGTSHVPTIAMAYDRKKRGRPRLGAAVRGLRAGCALARRAQARRAGRSSTTTTRRRSSSTTTRPSRSAWASATRSPTKASGRASCRRCAITRSSRATSHESLVNDEFDISVVPGPADRPRLPFAADDVLAARSPTGRGGRADRDQRAAAPAADAAALLQARPGRAPRGAIVSRGPEGRHRRHRRPVAPDDTASAPASTTPSGTCSSSICIERDPSALTTMTHADYMRLGGTEGAEEIMWLAMRGALSDARRSSTRTTTCR